VNGCEYKTLVQAPCLNFSKAKPPKKVEYEINGEATRLYWVDDYNPDRFIDINKIPYKKEYREGQDCDPTITEELDCNAIKIQANFNIPRIELDKVDDQGQLIEGTYQFGVQYSDSIGTGYTDVYNITNPIPIFRGGNTTQNFDNP